MDILRRRAAWAVSLAVLLVGASGFGAEPDGTVSCGPWSFSYDAADGTWLELTWNDHPVLGNPGRLIPFDFQAPKSTWIVSGARVTNARWDAAAGRLELERTAGEWRLTERIVFGAAGNPNRIARTIECLNTGRAAAKFHGLSVRWMLPPQGEYLVPTRAFDFRRSGPLAGMRDGESVHAGGTWPILIAPEERLTLLCVSDGRRDPTWASLRRAGKSVVADNYFDARGWAEPGVPQTIGPAYLEVVPAALDEAFESAVWRWYDDIGLKVPADRPQWVSDAALYALHPGGTIGSNFRDLGGFVQATKELLPRIARLGFGAVWLLPLEDRSCYWPRDYYKLMSGIGSATDYKGFVDAAHALGLKVWQDNVPHGGSPSFGRLRGNKPWWLVFDENGDALHYWCFDFHEPGWQAYIAGVADHYMREFGIDGFRMDAVGGSHAMNWRRSGFPSVERVPNNVPPQWWRDELKAVDGVPALPYERGSLTLREGGLQMIEAIRKQVKKHKPREGAVLAEVPHAPYMQAGDVVYDFAFHYVLLTIRHRPPEEFAPGLQDWLHEQKYSEPRGTIRLRYVESHDTVRGAGFLGVAANRALTALSCWIDGMPLVYHDSDIGNEEGLVRILAVRSALSELRRGEAHYSWTRAEPASVFTCVRAYQDRASVVAVNLSGAACHASIPLPWDRLAIGGRVSVWDVMAGRRVAVGPSARIQRVDIDLPPWGYTVLALRPAGARAPITWPRPEPVAPAVAPRRAPSLARTPQTISFRNERYAIKIDRATAMPVAFTDGSGPSLLGSASLVVSGAAEAFEGPTEGESRGEAPLTWRFGDGASITYRFEDDHVSVLLRAGPETAVGRLGLLLRPARSARTRIATAEGVLEDSFPVRHASGRQSRSAIYYRTQGSPAVWQSRLTPLGPDGGSVRCVDETGRGLEIEVGQIRSPNVSVVALDRAAGVDGMHLAAFVRDPGRFVRGPSAVDELTLRLRPVAAPAHPDAMPPKHAVTLRNESTAWVVQNAHYRVRLNRCGGLITRLWALAPEERVVMEANDVYTDKGFPVEGPAPRATSDGETATAVWREGDVLRMRFEGMIRGEHRFGRVNPPLWFSIEYAFDGERSFRARWSVMSEGPVRGTEAFLAWNARLPDLGRIEFSQRGALLSAGTLTGSRTGQTRPLPGRPVPDAIVVSRPDGAVSLRLTGLETRGPEPIHNVFSHRNTLYMAWLDPPDRTITPGAWYEASIDITPGGSRPAATGKVSWVGGRAREAFGDPSFEASAAGRLVTVPDGTPVDVPGESEVSPWSSPGCGRIVADHVRSGLRSAMVDNRAAEYALFTQGLDRNAFPPGARVRLRAWVRGENIVVGDVGWKTGILGLHCAMADGKNVYPSVADFSGSFEWREVSGTITIPPDALNATLRVGLNGANGRLWIDDVSVERVE